MHRHKCRHLLPLHHTGARAGLGVLRQRRGQRVRDLARRGERRGSRGLPPDRPLDLRLAHVVAAWAEEQGARGPRVPAPGRGSVQHGAC